MASGRSAHSPPPSHATSAPPPPLPAAFRRVRVPRRLRRGPRSARPPPRRDRPTHTRPDSLPLPLSQLTLFFLFYLTEDENAYTIALSVSLSFVTGATLSASAGWWGMMVATDGNAKTTAACAGDRANGVPGSLNAGLNVAFSTGAVMGFAVVGARAPSSSRRRRRAPLRVRGCGL